VEDRFLDTLGLLLAVILERLVCILAQFEHDEFFNDTATTEIYTMGPEVYLWSYNQAQRYSQATTTYARELAPRY
jgi:hypothetical protein